MGVANRRLKKHGSVRGRGEETEPRNMPGHRERRARAWRKWRLPSIEKRPCSWESQPPVSAECLTAALTRVLLNATADSTPLQPQAPVEAPNSSFFRRAAILMESSCLRARLGVVQKKTTMAPTESCQYTNHYMSSTAPLSFVLLASGACVSAGWPG